VGRRGSGGTRVNKKKVRVRDVPVSAKTHGSSERRPGQKMRAVTPICLVCRRIFMWRRGAARTRIGCAGGLGRVHKTGGKKVRLTYSNPTRKIVSSSSSSLNALPTFASKGAEEVGVQALSGVGIRRDLAKMQLLQLLRMYGDGAQRFMCNSDNAVRLNTGQTHGPHEPCIVLLGLQKPVF
jgi:hypothetical protein